MKKLVLTIVFLIVVAIQAATAEVPNTLSYQGYLEDNGAPVNGQKNLTFKIYSSETGGNIVWQNTLNTVNIDNGVFSVTLSDGSPSLGSVAFNRPYWITVTVDGIELGRVPLTSTPYSLRAKIADDIVTNKAVKSLNGRTGAVKIEAGDNVTLEQNGNALKISAVVPTGGSTPTSSGNTIKSLNGLTGAVKIEAGDNVKVERQGNSLKISADAPSGGNNSSGLSGSGKKDALVKWGANNALTESKILETGSGNNTKIEINAPRIEVTTSNSDPNHTVFSITNSNSQAKLFSAEKGSGNGAVGLRVDGDGKVEMGKGVRVNFQGLAVSNTGVVSAGNGVVTDSRFKGLTVNNDGVVSVGSGSAKSSNFKGMTISKDGVVGIQMRNPNRSFALQVGNDFLNISNKGQVIIGASRVSSGGVKNTVQNTSPPRESDIKLYVKGTIVATKDIALPSDIRYKKNVRPIEKALNTVRSLQGVHYELIEDKYNQQNVGFVAQEVEKVLPDVVITDGGGYKAIKYASMVSVLVEAMKEMDSEMQHLKARIAELEEKK